MYGNEGHVQCGEWRPGDPELRRQARMVKALDDKLPKLRAARSEGDITCLVVEDQDFQTTNSVVLAQALFAAGRCRSDLPEVIESVRTFPAENLEFWELVKDGSSWAGTALQSKDQ
jgi:hypothetical protein